MEQQWIYYFRDDKNRPMVTVCLIRANGNTARGVAVCSTKDNPNKKLGKIKARARAVQAMINKSSKSARYIKNGRSDISRWERALAKYNVPTDILELSEFDPSLTTFEEQLVK